MPGLLRMKFLRCGRYFEGVSQGCGVWHHVNVKWGKETSVGLWVWSVPAGRSCGTVLWGHPSRHICCPLIPARRGFNSEKCPLGTDQICHLWGHLESSHTGKLEMFVLACA